ncbi:MAG: hypothetical protein GY898_08610 [Proteobacteria bacterium]|nr:hypothetical protein [Pseudomonadota bacterium]
MQTRLVWVLGVVMLVATGCGPTSRGGDDDDASSDDDDASSDDDDASSDDDDASTDDDDASTDDDDASSDDDDASSDDDDVAPDDDDTTPAEEPAWVDETYCLDWDQTSIVEPSALLGTLNSIGINLEDWPILLTPTGADESAGSIWMMSGTALQGTCTQNTTISTTNLTQASAGTLTGSSFSVGPVDATLAAGILSTTVYDAVITGTFSSDAQEIFDGTLTGLMDVATIPGACFLLTCVTCPSGGDCVTLTALDAVYAATGAGPLVAVP